MVPSGLVFITPPVLPQTNKPFAYISGVLVVVPKLATVRVQVIPLVVLVQTSAEVIATHLLLPYAKLVILLPEERFTKKPLLPPLLLTQILPLLLNLKVQCEIYP